MNKENMFLNELNYVFLNPNWENDQNDPFESALSSMVSSPTTSSNCVENPKNNNVQLRGLIGKLSTICSNYNINNSTNTSCYNTPLNLPPKLNLSIMENNQQIKGLNLQNHGNPFPPFSTDQGLAERAARFSCFAKKGSLIGLNAQQGLSETENSSLSTQITIGEIALKFRKRKSISKGKEKEISASAPAKDGNVESENSELSAKRSKSDNGSANEKDSENSNEDTNLKTNLNPQEPPKDYIHVRAQRGQATDAHSLAERVRREKIGKKMKFLQDLVPGCNKITGKAVMLDEIINYVQSLQRQVEFLSMKLATVDSIPDINMEALVSKDMFQSRGSSSHNMYTSDSYCYQSSQNLHTAIPNGTHGTFPEDHFNAALSRNVLSPIESLKETASQVSTFWENDLFSVVQMGYGQNQTHIFHGNLPTAQMKVELL